ncbi:hypothetical protein [Chryseobacterium vrystaatense]|uniref:Uncharacterized protein n=1 Tax=Chryseobacterium vrystaatense TaxID=307480 RepID=A0A1M4WCD5_9FLAO|nr:hypothetical protein [Chryseobacterium vrystaatense]SHE78810.1 hypothetical protein SAMN02787073_1128 [Chryseobacterium vrystaatense]
METNEEKTKTLAQSTLSKPRNFGTKLIKIPGLIARQMKDNFKTNNAVLFRNAGMGFKESYPLSMDNLEDMLWVEEADEDSYDHVRIYFTHYKDKFNGNYTQLKSFDNSLCLIYSRALGKSELDEYNAVYSLNHQVSVEKADFGVVRKEFEDVFQNVGGNGYTDFVMLPRVELLAYYSKVVLYNKHHNDNKIITINVCLAGALDAKKLSELEQHGIDNGEISPSSREVKKLLEREYLPNQLTVIFDGIDENNKIVSNVSDYDMNSLCPNQCP